MSRILSFLIAVLVCPIINAQISDHFSDGEFTTNPTWTVNAASDFTVAAGKLQSTYTTTNSSFYISTTNTLAVNCQWEFYVNLQFNTSGNNYMDVYLASDQPDLKTSAVNGYFVRIGGTLDEICLYKRSGSLSSAVKLIDGTDGITNLANNNLKIKVTRTAGALFDLERDVTGSGANYGSEGTVTDATYTTSVAFGFYIQQSTASFFGKHFIDDISVGPIVIDSIPPALVQASVTFSNSLDILFDEVVDLSSSQTAANYTVNNGIGVATSAMRDAGNFKLVHLTMPNSFVSGNTYTVTVNGIKDQAGNTIMHASKSFNYIVFGVPTFKDIVINEIYADPSPLVNLTNTEFLELYNRSTVPFKLNGLILTDQTSVATIGNYSLTPGGYVIICPMADTAQFTTLGYMNVLGVNSFPSLNNTSDHLYLTTAVHNLIDSVNYSDTWYKDAIKKGGGFSLEQINPYQAVTCSQANNWIASNDPDGGTPGFVNSVYSILPDTTGPAITSIQVLDSTHLSICFTDIISSGLLTDPANYILLNGSGMPQSAVINYNGLCVTLTLSSPLLNAANYTLSTSGLTDCNGNALNPGVYPFSYYLHKPYDVVIDELMADPDPAINLPTEEYLELKNRTPFQIHLKNWTISTQTSKKKLPDITILPDSFVVLTGNGNANVFYSNFGITVYEVVSFPSLTNDGGTLTLCDSNGIIIHSIQYKKTWYNDANKSDGGWSLEQIDPDNPCGEQDNWKASIHPNGGTPGIKNSVDASLPDHDLPELERIAVVSSDTILLTFTESIDPLSLMDPAMYFLDNGLNQPIGIFPVAPDFKKVKLKLSAPLQEGILYHGAIVKHLKDCAGNVQENSNPTPFALPEMAAFNDLVINEILFDPPTGGVDFVELYNRSKKTIDLSTLRIGSMDTLTGLLKDTRTISEESYLMFPGSYLVLSQNGAVIRQNYQTIFPKGFLDMQTLPAMNADADVITLSDKNDMIIDNFSYSAKMHFPLLVSTKGVSLERIDFARSTNDRTNWNSASKEVGFATPAYRNSQYLQADAGNGITINEPLFSPDNDGYQDVLNISYKLNEQGKAANIYIYDSNGRQVRYLTRNEQLQQEGTLSWNGINDENEKAPIGIYVVYVELFNLSGKVNKYKLACTLAGKL